MGEATTSRQGLWSDVWQQRARVSISHDLHNNNRTLPSYANGSNTNIQPQIRALSSSE